MFLSAVFVINASNDVINACYRTSRLSREDFTAVKNLLNEGSPPWRIPDPIYKASVDGFTEAAFHQKCDNVPGTVVFVWVDNGYVRVCKQSSRGFYAKFFRNLMAQHRSGD